MSALACRFCESDEGFLEHYADWTKQGIENLVVEDGEISYDYDGVTYGHYDSGEGVQFQCKGCDALANSLEFLLGRRDTDTISDDEAMAAIHRVLDGVEWGPDQIGEIGDIVLKTGRTIAPYDPEEEDEDG